MTDKEKLLKALHKKYSNTIFRTSDLFSLSTNEFIPINRRDRNARQLREEGLLERVAQWEEKYYPVKEGLYKLTAAGVKVARNLGQRDFFS